MLTHPIIDQLAALRLNGMHKALREQLNMPDIESMEFMQRLALLVEREATERASKALQTRLRKARLRQSACIEDIDFRTSRGLDRRLLLSLASCDWIRQAHNILLTGATGTGKSYLACALAHKACLEGYTARYLRLPRLMEHLAIARADGSYGKTMLELARIDLIVLDDWGYPILPDGPVPHELQRQAKKAIHDRPTVALPRGEKQTRDRGGAGGGPPAACPRTRRPRSPSAPPARPTRTSAPRSPPLPS